MSDDSAWCPTCKDTFESIRAACHHHNRVHTFDVHTTAICDNCGNEFRPTSSKNELKYCSEKCFSEAKSVEKIKKRCKNCSEIMMIYPSSDRKFCSRECSNHREHHPNWKGGSSDIRKTVEYREWTNRIHNKSDCCEECGSNDNLHAHHIVPVSVNEELATDPENGVLLCGSCHSDKHPDITDEFFK